MENKKNNEEKVGAGKYVEYSYRLYDLSLRQISEPTRPY